MPPVRTLDVLVGVGTLLFGMMLFALTIWLTTTAGSDEPGVPHVHKSRIAKHKTRTAHEGIPLVALRWDADEGGYMIELVVGKSDTPVEFVLDSGSGHLSAKGSGCKWTSCGDDGQDVCTTQACPCKLDKTGKRCDSQRYIPKGRKLQPGQDGAGTDTVMAFGSQEDTVSHYMEDVRMPHFTLHTCADMKRADVMGGGGGGGSHDIRDLVVHQIHTIKGTSSSNIMGLSLPLPNSPQVVVSKLSDVWSVILHDASGWFALQSLTSCFPKTEYMKMVWPREFSQFMTRFYVVPLISMSVSDARGQFTRVPTHRCPSYLVLDTGTTCCYTEPGLGAVMRSECGYDDTRSGLRFEVRGTGGKVVFLQYTADECRDPDNPQYCVFNCDPDTTLPEFTDIFGGLSVILFGATLMRNHYWEYDLSKNRVGVQRIL
jgi:hypothetical protein